MSDTTDRSDRQADRPAEVTDPLLWKLALDVADAHEPNGNGGCRNLLCAGQAWPCPAWNNAQRALRMARAGSGQSPHVARPAGRQGRSDLPTTGLTQRTRPNDPRAASAA
ncbi:hypothetical protein KBX06_21800 [Micromonospora sp. C31]|uniref:hypothetical protein n=1 Tax=Micromonospora sp. C31 TaxID=2824876 RepID=UPI001B361EC7|nr:hypothetical protein [Micromonospora sp. C31]MBQ1075771.1 hypothetical protein [Micromonospora sp. C31]